MIARVTHATCYVRDEEEALRFYRDVLGFEVNSDSPMEGGRRWLTVSTPGQKDFEIVLYNPHTWLEGEAQAKALDQIGSQALTVFATDDMDGLHAKLKAHGVKLDTEIGQMPWGRDLAFRDLYGNAMYVVEPPKGNGQ